MQTAWQPPTLETPRLLLRAVDDRDIDAIFAYGSNPNVTRFTLFETHRDREDTLTFLREFVIPHYVQQLPNPLGICRRENPAWLLGTLGCHWAAQSHKTMELGYVIAEEHWGQGIVAEAARALLDYVFATYDVIRIQAHCMAENTASARVMQKLGMSFEGQLRSAVVRRGRSWDMLMYSVLRNEWPIRHETE